VSHDDRIVQPREFFPSTATTAAAISANASDLHAAPHSAATREEG
jgi:hypothetical protein